MKPMLVSLIFIFSMFSHSPTADAQNIFISGSSTVKKIIDKAIDVYTTKHPDTYFSVEGDGSSTGFAEMRAKTVDIGMMSRDLSVDEKGEMQGLTYLLLAYDTVVPVVSDEVFHSGITSLSKAQITKIYRGEITNWRQLGGADKKILVVNLSSENGTHTVFYNYFLASLQDDVSNLGVEVTTTNDVVNLITASDQAIAYLSTSYTDETVHSISITEDDQEIQPLSKNISNGKYPLSRKLCLVVQETPPSHVNNFIQFLLSKEGQNIAQQEGYLKAY